LNEKLKLLGHVVLDSIVHYFWGLFLLIVPGITRIVLRKIFGNSAKQGEAMEKEVVLSKESKVEVKLAAGKLYLVAKYDGADTDAEVSVGIEVDLLLNKLKEKIPGQIDDAVIEVLKAALKVI